MGDWDALQSAASRASGVLPPLPSPGEATSGALGPVLCSPEKQGTAGESSAEDHKDGQGLQHLSNGKGREGKGREGKGRGGKGRDEAEGGAHHCGWDQALSNGAQRQGK